ncbi:hypothetical protein C8Q79DRAFT_939773 [Trametes meyenii]|nr:hypothetical protein C8Q79DRAFT_939773 [Trametes meyenii]
MDSEGAAILANLNRGGTIGVGYIGVAITSIVYGITCIQTFQYFMSPKAASDSYLLRGMVLVLWLLDSFQESLAIHIFYFYLVENYANPVALLGTVWSIPSEILVNTLITIIVKCFFILKIWRISRNKLLTCICCTFLITLIVVNFNYIIRFFGYPTLLDAEQKLRAIGCASLAIVVSGDSLIVGSLVYYLYKGRSGLRKSDSMISRLIALLISTSMLSSLIVTGNLISYLTAPSQLYVLFFNMLMGKMDVNAVLTSLNSREFVRGDSDTVTLNTSNAMSLSMFRVPGGTSGTFTGVEDSRSHTKSTGTADDKPDYLAV